MAASGTSAPEFALDIPVRGMSCASCVGRVEKAIRAVDGVTAATVNLATGRASVRDLGGADTVGLLAAAVAQAGYEAAPVRREGSATATADRPARDTATQGEAA